MKTFNSLLVHYMCISGILLTLMGFSMSLQINTKCPNSTSVSAFKCEIKLFRRLWGSRGSSTRSDMSALVKAILAAAHIHIQFFN